MTESSDVPQASSSTSEADADHEGGSAAPDEASIAGISDEQLPEDLQGGEDNPLAEPLDPDAEESKDAEELGMQDTQDDTTGTFHSEGELGTSDTLEMPTVSSDSDSDSDSDGEDEDTGSSKGDGAQGAGITG